MNDFRIDAYFDAVGQDLREFFPPDGVQERLREMRGHLDEAIQEHRDAGELDPVGAALAEFGNSDGYRLAAQTAVNGILVRQPERAVIRWAAFLLLVPMGLDLLMDAASWFTGSDSSLWAVTGPLIGIFTIGLLVASIRCRRFLAAPLMSMIMVSFAVYLALGGWTRATDTDGLVGTRTRGTAFRRLGGVLGDSLPQKEAIQEKLRSGAALFSSPIQPPDLGPFAVKEGFLVPSIPQEWRDAWKNDERGSRWLIDQVEYKPVPSYAAAHDAWQTSSPELVRLAASGVAGEKEEIAELERVVACPWLTSVKAEIEPKVAMGLACGGMLLLVHGLGVVGGGLSRLWRNGRKGTAA